MEPPSTVTLQVEGKPPPEGWRVVAGDGQENRLPATSRGLTLELRALPQYVDLGKGRLLR